MKTEIIVITDRSGSMSSIADDVIGGFNTFLKEQKEAPGEALITFTQFDDKYEVVYCGMQVKAAANLTRETFVPRGGTALYDAIGRTLNDQGARIAREKWAELVVVCIITDGGENSSREYTSARVKEMTAHAEKNGWKFVFLAANQDAFAAAGNIGISSQYVGSYVANAAGTSRAYASTSATVTNLRAGNFTPGLVVSP